MREAEIARGAAFPGILRLDKRADLRRACVPVCPVTAIKQDGTQGPEYIGRSVPQVHGW